MDNTAIALLGQQLTDFLVKQFAPPAGTKTTLGFLGTGVAVEPDSFLSGGQFNPARINQWLDIVVDPLGEISSGTNQVAYTPWTATQLLEAIYSQARCLAPPDSDEQRGFAKAQSTAMEGLGGATTVSTAPLDWYDPARLNQWPTCSLTASSATGSGTAPPPPVKPLWAWRNLRPAVFQAGVSTSPAGAHSLESAPLAKPDGAPLPTINLLQKRRLMFSALPPSVASAGVETHMSPATGAAHAAQPSPHIAQQRIAVARIPASFASVQRVTPAQALLVSQAVSTAAQQATTSSVASNSLSLHLKYQVVSLSRAPWWSEFFLLLNNWYITGCGRASMIEDSDGQTVTGVPIALILTSDVSVQGNWSSADRAAAASNTHFGPWALGMAQFTAAATAGEAALAIPGIQAIACIYRQLPALPPQTDPGLPVAATTNPSPSQTPTSSSTPP